MRKMIRPFWWHQNLVPWGLSAPALGLHVFNHEKKICIKSDFKDVFFKLATNEWSDKTYLLTSKLCPLGAVCPLLMNIYCIKSDFKEIFWNLQHMTEVTRGSCWHQNFVPKELSAPSLGIYTCIRSWKKLYKIIQRVFFLFFFKLVANDLSDKRFLLTSKFYPLVPWGCLPLIYGCTHLLNHEKMCIKSEVGEILFKLATNDHSDEAFLLT